MRPFVSLALIALTSCASAAPRRADPASHGSGAADEAGYEVHEWGLVRAGAGDVLEVGAFGPGIGLPLMVVEKPVLYFHLDGDEPIALTSVRAVAQAGELREHWPLSAHDATSVTWGPLMLRRGACPLLPPSRREEACAGLPEGETCESLGLAVTVASDADCVVSEGGESPLLFYRSTSRGLVAPLRASRRGDEVIVEHTGSAPLPGLLVRFDGTWAGVQATIVTPPAPGETLHVAAGTEAPDVARAAIDRSMRELGMTSGEAAAFLSAWDRDLFAPSEDVAEEIVERMPAPVVTLLYFLPPADVDRLATLELTPAPRAVRRAMAVWTAVP